MRGKMRKEKIAGERGSYRGFGKCGYLGMDFGACGGFGMCGASGGCGGFGMCGGRK